VSYWLRESMSLPHLVAPFQTHSVDGTVLCRLTLEMLRDDLGVASVGHRFKIVDTARELRREYMAKLEKRRGNRCVWAGAWDFAYSLGFFPSALPVLKH
jgi:hypothetical protein